MNDDCIERIFYFLGITDQIVFRKGKDNFSENQKNYHTISMIQKLSLSVCCRWYTLFQQFWKITELKVLTYENDLQTKSTNINLSELHHLLGNRALSFLKCLNIKVCSLESANIVIIINDTDYRIIEKFKIHELIDHIANVCTKIKSLRCHVPSYVWKENSIDVFSESLLQLIKRNKSLKRNECFSKEKPSSIELESLTKSIEEIALTIS